MGTYLKKYKDDGFWKENQYFTVYSETTAYRYRIFSYEDAVNGGDVYKVGYQPGEEYQKFIDQMIKIKLQCMELQEEHHNIYFR